VFTYTGAFLDDIFAAINFVIAKKRDGTFNTCAINLSLGTAAVYASPCGTGGFGWESDVEAALFEARAAGIVVAAASGNRGDASGISAPACTPSATAVGAVYDSNLGRSDWGNPFVCSDRYTYQKKVVCFSNSAGYLSLLAPGAGVVGAGQALSGTSQATPHVAGAVAVLKGAAPNATTAEIIKVGVFVCAGLGFSRGFRD